jgi:hypothetical protein
MARNVEAKETDSNANDIHARQAAYQQALIDFAIEKAKRISKEQSLFFDPQGRLLIEVDLDLDKPEISDNQQLDEKSSSDQQSFKLKYDALVEAAFQLKGLSVTNKTLCSIDIHGTELAGYFLNSLGEKHKPKLEALFDSGSRSSVISLQEEVMMHGFLTLNLIKKAFKGANKNPPENEVEKIRKELHSHVNVKVNEAFKKALDKAYNKKAGTIDFATLNKVLDKARKTISLDVEKFLAGKVRRFVGGEVIEKITKHLAESATATDNDFLHTDASVGLTTFIEHSSNTSHNRGKGGETLALRQMWQCHYRYSPQGGASVTESSFPRIQVRVPSIALKGSATEEAIDDVVSKLEFIKDKYSKQSPDSDAVIYYLFTALNGNKLIDRYDERNNKQRESADRIFRGAHRANKSEIEANPQKPLYCFVQNISVNGFGQSLGYSWYKKSTTKEATLMTEIALLHTLKENDELIKREYNNIIEYYKDFLKNNGEAIYFHDSKQGKKAISIIKGLKENLNRKLNQKENNASDKEKSEKSSEEGVGLLDSADVHTLAKNALKNLFAQNKHFDHKYAKLIQTLSVFCEQFSVGGCKSANERAQAVNGRVGMLVSLSFKKQSQAELFQIEEDFISALNPESLDPKTFAQTLNKALDRYYNECGLQGGPSKVSLLDQGGSSKLQSDSQSGLMPNTNYGESAELSYLYQSKASKMQAHKGLAERLRNFINGTEPLSGFRKIAYGILSLVGLGFLVSKVSGSIKNKNIEDVVQNSAGIVGALSKEEPKHDTEEQVCVVDGGLRAGSGKKTLTTATVVTTVTKSGDATEAGRVKAVNNELLLAELRKQLSKCSTATPKSTEQTTIIDGGMFNRLRDSLSGDDTTLNEKQDSPVSDPHSQTPRR